MRNDSSYPECALLLDKMEWKTISAVPVFIMLRILNGRTLARLLQYNTEMSVKDNVILTPSTA